MKKRFLPPLLFFLLFGLVSCPHQVSHKTDISMTIPVQGLYNQVAARNADDNQISLVLEVSLTVDGVKGEPIQQTVLENDVDKTFDFGEVPLNSKVKAQACVKTIVNDKGFTHSMIVMYGESEEKTVTAETLVLEVQLEWNEDIGLDDDEGKTPLVIQYYLKDGSSYNLYNSIACKTNYTLDEIKEALKANGKIDYNSSFYRYFEWELFSLILDVPEYKNDNSTDPSAWEEDGTIYVRFNYVRQGEKAQYKDITGTAGGQTYILKLYAPQLYSICDSFGEPFVIGVWETSEIDDTVWFTESMYKKNGKPLFNPYNYVDGEIITDKDIDVHPDKINWNSETTSFVLNYHYTGGSLPITFNLKEHFDITEFEIKKEKENNGGNGQGGNGSDEHEIDLTDANIIYRFYTKAPGEEYQYHSAAGIKADFTYDEILDNSYLPFSDDDLYAAYMWKQFYFVINGYESPQSNHGDTDSPVTVTQENGKIYVNCYLIKKREVASKVTMQGRVDNDIYTLVLYDIGDYEILDSNNQVVLFGMWASGLDGQPDTIISFSEFMYQKNGMKKLSPNFYKDGELVMDGDDPRFDLKPDYVNWNSTSQTFSLTYYFDDTYFPITFEKPANFNIVEFENHNQSSSGGGGGDSDAVGVYSQIVINNAPKFSISKTYSDDPIYLNNGLFSFYSLVMEQTNDWDWSVKLFDAGQEVPASAYKVTVNGSECNIKPIALPGAEAYYPTKTFIAHVTASSSSLGTVSSNFEITVQNKNTALLSLNDENFLTELIDLFANASGLLELRLSGTGQNPVYNPDANVYKMINYTIKQYAKSDVELDLSLVTTPNVNYLDLNDFTSVVKKITLPASIGAIRLNPQVNIQIVTPEDNYYTDSTWYSVAFYSYNDGDEEYLEELLAGTKLLNEETRNELNGEDMNASCEELTPPGGTPATTSWETIVMWVGGNYRNTQLSNSQAMFIKGE